VVEGLKRFAEHFAGYDDRYVLIGGAATFVALDAAALDFRVTKDLDIVHPEMIELIARTPDLVVPPADWHLTPIPVSGDVSSLSAILIDDDYYQLVMEGGRNDAGVTVLAPAHLIPLKATAWLDLTERRLSGKSVQSGDIKKHRNDVVRLGQLIPPGECVSLPGQIKADLAAFIAQALQDGPEPKAIGVAGMTLADVRLLVTQVYGL
jgi:hypothetical protein